MSDRELQSPFSADYGPQNNLAAETLGVRVDLIEDRLNNFSFLLYNNI